MPTVPGPSEKQPAEGARDVIERELERAGSGVKPAKAATNPGDEAPPGTPGTGEAVCPMCGGSGQRGGSACPNCGGSGKIIKAIGGA